MLTLWGTFHDSLVVLTPRFPPGECPAPLYLQIQAHAALTVAPCEVPHQPRVLHCAAF